MVGTLGPGIGVGRAARFKYVATAGQTTFSGADASAQALTMNYTPGYLEVAVDGIWLSPDEYTATNGSSIVFSVGLAVGRVVYAYVLSTMSVANTYDKTQNGADITDKLAFLGNVGVQFNCGYLSFTNGTQIFFQPWMGDLIRINGLVYRIGAGSIVAANTSVFVNGVAGQNLAASTLYYVYVFNNGGTLTIDFSTTAPELDLIGSNVGTMIKSSAVPSRSLVGMVFTNASSQFVVDNTISWFNKKARQVAAAGTATTGVAAQVEFCTWGDEAISFGINAKATNGTVSAFISTQLTIDGTPGGMVPTSFCNAATVQSSVSLSGTKLLSAGRHTLSQTIASNGTPSAANEETYVMFRG